jgi:glycosyltransferase involved in cell wall biosynthesis
MPDCGRAERAWPADRGSLGTMQDKATIRPALDAHVVGRRKTGNETYIVNLADALARRTDMEPIAYVDAGTPWPHPDGPKTRDLKVRAPLLRIPFELPARARRDGCDLLHVQYVAPPLAGLPVVTTIHDVSFEDVPGLFSRASEMRLKLSVRVSARRSAAIVTVSEFSRDRLVRRYGLDPERIHVTPLGVDSRWRPLGPDEAAARLRELDPPSSFVLAVGNLHPRKNIPRLIHAVAAARKAGAGDLYLLLAGQRWWRSDDVDRAIEEADASGWLRLLGYVDGAALPALYSAATVVAHPSLYEGFGLPVLEALACGAVVVASNTTSIPEVAGTAALLVDPTDDAAIAKAIAPAATDPIVRARLKRAGPRQAALFSWARCAELTVKAYQFALSRG